MNVGGLANVPMAPHGDRMRFASHLSGLHGHFVRFACADGLGYHSYIDLMLTGDFKQAAQRACRDRAYRIAYATYATESSALDSSSWPHRLLRTNPLQPQSHGSRCASGRNRHGALTAHASLTGDWVLLNEYAGGTSYDAPPLPMSDFGARANEIRAI